MKRGLLVAAIVMFAGSAHAAVQSISAKGGDVEFLAVGKPSFIKIHGKGSAAIGKVSLDAGKVNGQFEFDVTSLDTGIDKRNEHMKEKYLEIGKYPKASLDLKGATVAADWSLQKPQLPESEFNGVLTLHGVSKPVTGKYKISDAGAVEVEFALKLTDYGVAIPSFAGITVADEVTVTVKIDKLDAT